MRVSWRLAHVAGRRLCTGEEKVSGGIRDSGIKRLRTIGDPVLRQPALPVGAFDEHLRHLVEMMARVMEEGDGVGLAANQIGVLSRVLLWKLPEQEEGEYQVCINPEILETSESCGTEHEGCLSIPGVTVEVTRPEVVVLRAQGLAGESFSVELAGLPARIVQHEIDHLDGRLILDRTSPEEYRRALKELRERVLSLET